MDILCKPMLYRNATMCFCINCKEIYKYKQNYYYMPKIYNKNEIENILKFHKKIIYINNEKKMIMCNNICQLNNNQLNNIITNHCGCYICNN